MTPFLPSFPNPPVVVDHTCPDPPEGLVVQQTGIHLATDFYLPFELISLILLVSLIGAITMARQ
uniref:NADH-ubiquinone oxidoreductase chain 6 n=1 Tax=Setaria viridis TaxID=4556 RepID=A0A4U6U352_SETVI|nr:hypothetical protein SEVIR_6G138700v2 [Setaria viridis]